MSTALSPEMQQQLEALRDITLPDPVGWWPLATAWWVLIAMIICTLTGMIIYRIRRRRSVGFVALNELSALRAKAAQTNIVELASELSVLLRRVAMRISSPQTGALNSAEWVIYLTQGKQGMAAETAEFLAQAPYAPTDAPAETAPKAPYLLDVAELWIRRHT